MTTPAASPLTPGDNTALNPRWFIEAAWFAASCAIVIALAGILGADLVDDAYIFLRYAENIAGGLGAVFNVGERVEGFSSPLWTLLLAGVGAVVGAESAAMGLGVLCSGALVLVLRAGMRRPCVVLQRGTPAVIAIGLVCLPPVAAWSVSGMETSLFTLLVTASLVSALRDQGRGELSPRTGLLVLAASTTRMEGVLLAGYLVAWFFRSRRTFRLVILYALAGALLSLARHGYYGAWLPNTFYAKVTPAWGERLMHGLHYVGWPLLAFSPLIALGVGEAVRKRGRVRATTPCRLLLGWVGVWLCYVVCVGGDNFALHRFLMPALPVGVLALGLAWMELPTRGSAARRWRTIGLAAAFAASGTLVWRREARNHLGDVRLTHAWAKTGRWLAQATPPDAVLATCVPGAIGYFSGRTTIDMLGLTDRTVAIDGGRYAAAAHAHERFHTDYLFARAPDVVVYHTSGRFPRPVYAEPRSIDRRWGNALYEFVSDPRCPRGYQYTTAKLADGTVVEMQVKVAGRAGLQARAPDADGHRRASLVELSKTAADPPAIR